MTNELYEKIVNVFDEKINYLNALIDDLRSQNNDTKSSMGDKYETSREMMQQEITRIQNQLNEVLIQQDQFLKLGVKESKIIINGSYVETSMGNFLIGCSLGEIKFDDKKIFVLSNQTALAKVILGKSVNDTFQMNGKTFQINKVD
ncbi:MAG: hypothetical protein KIG88_01965 [Weeksellaceae bacterium]|nr:hypothetical protein [Weeksellaceae bacterium]